MTDICGDNRFELIERYKQKLISATNIENSPEEMAVIDNILLRCWQIGWLDLLEKQEKLVSSFNFAIEATDGKGEYFKGMRNGIRYCKSLVDGETPKYE